MTTSRLPMIPTHVMGSHGFRGWFWTALDKIKAGRHASPAPAAMPTEVWINPPTRSALAEVRLLTKLEDPLSHSC
jgi:hypothetical protein